MNPSPSYPSQMYSSQPPQPYYSLPTTSHSQHSQSQPPYLQQYAPQPQGLLPAFGSGEMSSTPTMAPVEANNMGQQRGGAGEGGAVVVYATSYAGAYGQVPVFEAMVRGIAVMMRRSDMWLNATQILKVAGVSKINRSRFIEDAVANGPHEKVQGSYGKYQGTWVPFPTGLALSQTYNVSHLLQPIFAYHSSTTSPPQIQSTNPGRQASPGNSNIRGKGYPTPSGFATQAGGHGNQMGHLIDPNLSSTPISSSTSAQQMAPTPSPMRFDSNSRYGALQAPMSLVSPGQSGVYEQPQEQGMYFQLPAGAAAGGQILQPQSNGGGMGMMQPPAVPLGGQGVKRGYEEFGGGGGYGLAAAPEITGGPMNGSGSYGYGGPKSDGGSGVKKMRGDGAGDVSMEIGEDAAEGEGDVDGRSEASGHSVLERQPLPAGMKLSNKPSRPKTTVPASLNVSASSNPEEQSLQVKRRGRLLSIFEVEEGADLDLSVLLGPSPKTSPNPAAEGPGDMMEESVLGPPVMEELDIDQVIDDRGHTALHWATALAREKIVAQLIQRGADVGRGNFAGETPLIRSVLTTNNADRNSFASLLESHLAPSLRIVDHSYRTVLHHIALIAGIKGRALSANSYMSTMLEYLATHEDRDQRRAFVSSQDVNGDTALNVAARVGNRNIVKLLLEAGADAAVGNDLGLRPVDFGVDVQGLEMTNGEASKPAAKRGSAALQKSTDMLQRLNEMVQTLNGRFKVEIGSKQETIDRTQREVVAATRELADHRRKVQAAQLRLAEMEEVQQRIANLERAVKDEDSFDWSGLGVSGGSPESKKGSPSGKTVDPPSPAKGDITQLRRVRQWQTRTADLMQGRLQDVAGLSAEKVVQYSKVVAACAKVPIEMVNDKMVQDLTIAVESDGELSMSKMSAFMSRVSNEEQA